MKWHRFSGPVGERPAPDFCLVSDAGDTICDHVYRQRVKQVLVFVSGSTPADWTPVLHAAADHAEEVRRHDAVLLALVPAEPQAIRDLGGDLTYHYPILADVGGQVRRAYDKLLGEEAGTSHTLFVLDTFGAPYAAAVNLNPADPLLFDEVSKWLGFIAIQCPE